MHSFFDIKSKYVSIRPTRDPNVEYDDGQDSKRTLHDGYPNTVTASMNWSRLNCQTKVSMLCHHLFTVPNSWVLKWKLF